MATATYLSDQTARVLRSTITRTLVRPDASIQISCDDTIFHPIGGGQPADTGQIEIGDLAYPVSGVFQDDAGVIWHVLETSEPPLDGSVVNMTIDWARRYRLMRTHTATHLVCAVGASNFGATVTGCEMTELQGRVDFDGLPGGIASELTRLLNEAVASASEVSIAWLDAEQARSDPDLVRTKTNRVPAHVDSVRVVTIGTVDRQADGGTHVARTDEIGRIVVTKVESKGRSNRRVRFIVGD